MPVNRGKLVDRVALAVIRDLREADHLPSIQEDMKRYGAHALVRYSDVVVKRLKKFSRHHLPATLGKIIASHKTRNDDMTHGPEVLSTSLYNVHNQHFLDKYGSGRELLMCLAVTVVLARMADFLFEGIDGGDSEFSSEDLITL